MKLKLSVMVAPHPPPPPQSGECGQEEPLSVEHALWANCVLASGTATCVVVYTGPDTRSVMNTSSPRSKVSG